MLPIFNKKHFTIFLKLVISNGAVELSNLPDMIGYDLSWNELKTSGAMAPVSEIRLSRPFVHDVVLRRFEVYIIPKSSLL